MTTSQSSAEPGASTPDDDDPRISYAEFGRAFFAQAVTPERILGAVGGIAGDPISFGPIHAGPGGIARVSANGIVGEAEARRMPGDEIAFRLTIPVALDLKIDLGVDVQSFKAKVRVGLTLTARAAPPLRVVIDIETPHSKDVLVDVESTSRRGIVLQVLAGIDREIGRFVARYVARELEKPHILQARDIDVASRIDGAWKP